MDKQPKDTDDRPVIPGWGKPLTEAEVIQNALHRARDEYVDILRPQLEAADRTDEVTINCYLSNDREIRDQMKKYWTAVLNDVCDELAVGWDWDEQDIRNNYPNPRVRLKSKQVEKDDAEEPCPPPSKL